MIPSSIALSCLSSSILSCWLTSSGSFSGFGVTWSYISRKFYSFNSFYAWTSVRALWSLLFSFLKAIILSSRLLVFLSFNRLYCAYFSSYLRWWFSFSTVRILLSKSRVRSLILLPSYFTLFLASLYFSFVFLYIPSKSSSTGYRCLWFS